jgi:hypothetical protein
MQSVPSEPPIPAVILPAAPFQGHRNGCYCRQHVEKIGGASRARTDDLIVANDALSQLSYSPIRRGAYVFDFNSVARFRIYTPSQPFRHSPWTNPVSRLENSEYAKTKTII